MSTWRDIKIDHINLIEKLVAEFNVCAIQIVPYGKFKVRVFEHPDGSFTGYPNIAVKNAQGSPDWMSGWGKTVDEALEDTIRQFLMTVGGRLDLPAEAFEYSDPHDF
jgi:hypothetical protein